jgi:uncharacterized membrane protein
MQKLKWMLFGSGLTLVILGLFLWFGKEQTPPTSHSPQTHQPAENPGSIYATAQPQRPAPAVTDEFAQVERVIRERCTVCHSNRPTSPLFSEAPAAVLLDTPDQIRQMAPRIKQQAVDSSAMPLGNVTQMTQAERDLIGHWVSRLHSAR